MNQKRKINAIIDTNIIISSFLTKNKESPTKLVLSAFINHKFNMFYSTEILNEYKDVLNREKFIISKEEKYNLFNAIKNFSIYITPTPYKSNIKFIDLNDVKFYDVYVTIYNLNPYLITGNLKHFPKEKNIVSPREFINLFK